ncbi:serine/threonine-protein phosphatase 4 regulatory subunit 1 isoform X2 [Lampris incognitus]|nr:serine/threonine-protein phosphatase 4 regulatory subunit 1 isoform X2 [Lampris incognitus]
MEQLPRVVALCNDCAVWSALLPVLLRYLGDSNNQVRKTAQAALLVLVEQEVLKSCDLEKWVCPVLVDLSAPDANDDVKTEAMAMMCQVSRVVGKDVTEKLFLPRFCQLCCDCRMFHVRKVCAANFGDMCSVVGGEATEQLLLPRFYQLCTDSVWGVRKACAECFTAVSMASPPDVRRNKLAKLFTQLISDPSRWVRQAAFQSLGQFISSFASKQEPHTSGRIATVEAVLPVQPDCISHNSLLPKEGTEERRRGSCDSHSDLDLYVSTHSYVNSQTHLDTEAEGAEEERKFNSFFYWRTPTPIIDLKLLQEINHALQTPATLSDHTLIAPSTPSDYTPSAPPTPSDHTPNMPSATYDHTLSALPTPSDHTPSSLPTPPAHTHTASATAGGEELSSSFPCLPLLSSSPALRKSQLEDLIENLEPHIDDPDVKAQVDVLTAALRATMVKDGPEEEQTKPEMRSPQCHRKGQRLLGNLGNSFSLNYDVDEDGNPEEETSSKQQDVIPQVLLDQYLSMTEPSRAQTVDTEITRHCAYSLPAVAMTLGRANWSCLRPTYCTLASDMQWKVRRTLAFSLHELALILGEELISEDLLPIFNSFLKDLDEVRIGILKHLYDFFRLLGCDVRRKYLHQLQDFLVTDNSRNWRFRSELAEQLVLLLELYSVEEVFDFFRPLALSLSTDQVSSVRETSRRLVTGVMWKLASCKTLQADFLSQLVSKLCHAPKWSHRQTYTTVCQLAVEEECVSVDQFSQVLLVPLLQLSHDPVPNVRALLAKILQRTLLQREYFVSGGCVHKEALQAALSSLQADLDPDVQYYASLTHTHMQ